MRRTLIILGLIAFMPGAARADVTVQLPHARLHLPIPDGYCPLDTERARESTAFNNEEKSYLGQGRLLALAVDCAQLEGFRLSEKPFDRYISIAATIKDGQLVQRPDTERAALLDETLQKVAKIKPNDAAAESNRWWSNFNVSVDVKEYGLAGHDENAVYLRLVGALAGRRREPISVAKIYAVTLAAGYEVSIAVYAQGDAQALPEMLELTKHEAARLVAANPPPPPPRPPVVFDPPTVAPADIVAAPLPPDDTIFGLSEGTIVMYAMIVMIVSILLLLMFRPVRRRR